MQIRLWQIVLVLMLFYSSSAVAVTLQGRLEQGGLAMGIAPKGAMITLDGQAVVQDEQGNFVLGFGREAPKTMELSINGQKQTLNIARRHWQVEKINGLPPAKVTPDPAQEKRIVEERALLAEIRQNRGAESLFRAGAIAPLTGRISGVFGSQRVLNGKPRSPHSGQDVAAATGTPVQALTDGVVVLAHPDLFFAGKMVVLDHGLGLQSVYAHLSQIDVQQGQTVRKGEVIGQVGSSGRATGPHLHWGVNWGDVRLDPATVLTVLEQLPQRSNR